MRLDYTLYGLAIIFFIIAAVSLVFVSDQTGKILLTLSTAVIGLVSVTIGFMLKPKVQTVASPPAPAIVQEAPPEQTPQTVTVEAATTEASKTETASTIEATVIEVPAVVAAPQAESSLVEAPVVNAVVTEAPAEIPAPAPPVPVTETPSTAPEAPVPTAPSNDLTQVKGIGEKRATQLKASGINNIADLAKVDAADLAAKLKVSPKIVEKWVAGAKDLTK